MFELFFYPCWQAIKIRNKGDVSSGNNSCMLNNIIYYSKVCNRNI